MSVLTHLFLVYSRHTSRVSHRESFCCTIGLNRAWFTMAMLLSQCGDDESLGERTVGAGLNDTAVREAVESGLQPAGCCE